MFKLPELPYDYTALEPYIDKRTMYLHHKKHHDTYVANLNKLLQEEEKLLALNVEQIIKSLDKVPEKIRAKVRNNAGGHYNHSFFWHVMTPKPQKLPGELARAIDVNFGNFENFKDRFTLAGLGRFGSGWVWLIKDNGDLKIIDTPNQDNPLMEGKIPLLTLDLWEHAYYLKYQNRRADYISSWWNIVNWEQVDLNYQKAFSG